MKSKLSENVKSRIEYEKESGRFGNRDKFSYCLFTNHTAEDSTDVLRCIKTCKEKYTELRLPEAAYKDFIDNHSHGYTDADYSYYHTTNENGEFIRIRLMNMDKLSKKD